jgi:hypothetical protein
MALRWLRPSDPLLTSTPHVDAAAVGMVVAPGGSKALGDASKSVPCHACGGAAKLHKNVDHLKCRTASH